MSPRGKRQQPDAPEALEPQSRPMPWQQRPWTELTELATTGRLPHGLLLEGRAGTGRLRFGLALARYLLCEAPTQEGNCGTCRNCLLTASGAHGDFRQLQPDEKGRAIGIDAVRAAIDFVHGSATRGVRKMLLVYPANAMTTAAFNAFLKCLEEPTADTHILMMSTAGHALPATIRSRCQRWLLPAPSATEAQQWLQEALKQGGDDPVETGTLLELCNFQPLDAWALARSGDGKALQELAAMLTDSGLAGAGRLSEASRLAAALEPERFLDLLEFRLQSTLRGLDGDALRATPGQRGFSALDEVHRLRTAQRSGANPNGDLLRFSALTACSGLWGS